MPSALAFRYARALADLAEKPGADPQAAARELQLFEEALESSPDLHVALESPAVPPPKKRAVIGRLAKLIPLSDLTRKFLLVLVHHRRMPMLREIRQAFAEVLDDRLGFARAEVASARPLTAHQRQEVLDVLLRVTGRQVRADFNVRAELIGGVVARVGSTVYDGSVAGQLEALKHKLVGAET